MRPLSGQEGKGLVEQTRVERFLLAPELTGVYERLLEEGVL